MPNVFTGIWWLSPPKSRWTKPTFAEKQSERVANTKLWANRDVFWGIKVMPANIGGIFWPSGKVEGGQQSNEESKLDVVCVVERRRLFLLLLLLPSLRNAQASPLCKKLPVPLNFFGGRWFPPHYIRTNNTAPPPPPNQTGGSIGLNRHGRMGPLAPRVG